MNYWNIDELELETVAELGYGGGYDWCVAIVFRHVPTGRLYGWSGCGCSCYGPLEDVDTLSDLNDISTLEDLRPLIADVHNSYYTSEELFAFQAKVRSALC